jgi:hypothetical protein
LSLRSSFEKMVSSAVKREKERKAQKRENYPERD